MNQQNMNAVEAWPPYDTVCIGYGLGADRQMHWYSTFHELATEDAISFFNKRNRSMAGAWATNLDSRESFPFAFQCYSIGIQFSAPAAAPILEYERAAGALTEPVADLVTHNHAKFAGELLKHAAVRLIVSQDEKLVTTALALPAGYGIAGQFNANVSDTLGSSDIAEVQTLGNGSPDFDNRFGFPVPVDIPRGHIVRVEVKFSNYAKQLLQRMEGPGKILINNNPNNGEDFTFSEATVDGVCMMEVTLYGPRYVQLRNQQRFI